MISQVYKRCAPFNGIVRYSYSAARVQSRHMATVKPMVEALRDSQSSPGRTSTSVSRDIATLTIRVSMQSYIYIQIPGFLLADNYQIERSNPSRKVVWC